MCSSKGVVLLNNNPLKQLHQEQRSTLKLAKFSILLLTKDLKALKIWW